MMRRSLLAMLAGIPLVGDGLVRPQNAPVAQQLPIGVQPGATSAVVRANQVIVFGSGGGIFVYSGTPSAGNLIASITSAPGTDAFGNAYLAEVTAYFQGSPSNAVQMQAGEISYYQAASFAGPWSTIGTIACSLAAGMTFSATGGLTLNGTSTVQSGNLTISGGHNLVVASTGTITSTGGTAASPTKITTDTRQVATLANSWTGTLAYRLAADQSVEVNGTVTAPAGVANPSVINVALPAAYQPANTQYLLCVEDPGGVHLGQALICQMLAAGTIQVFDATAGEASRISGRYSLVL